MSSDRTQDEGWQIQLAYHKANGTTPPTTIDAETEATLREILGDAEVDVLKALEPRPTYDPTERAKEKQASRDRDEAALASGEKTQEQLRRENGHFSFVGLRMDLAGCESLGG